MTANTQNMPNRAPRWVMPTIPAAQCIRSQGTSANMTAQKTKNRTKPIPHHTTPRSLV